MTKRRKPQRAPTVRPAGYNAPPEANPALGAAILEVVDTQLAENTPPETRATLERLVGLGYTREGARQLIAHAVVHEIFAVMSSGKPYDEVRYKQILARLPQIAGDDE